MARRSSSVLLAGVLCIAAACLLAIFASPAFATAPCTSTRASASCEEALTTADRTAQAAALGVALAVMPQAAHAATASYALLQLGWAVFIVGLGPAVLFWIYFNKPELL
mmetsp:Transcript_10587/g.14134  ORF Transcript_10587/g.14134 Transcript_10587/m.14134 type:complete len:109 (+) Transcript_10587:91-417(+)